MTDLFQRKMAELKRWGAEAEKNPENVKDYIKSIANILQEEKINFHIEPGRFMVRLPTAGLIEFYPDDILVLISNYKSEKFLLLMHAIISGMKIQTEWGKVEVKSGNLLIKIEGVMGSKSLVLQHTTVKRGVTLGEAYTLQIEKQPKITLVSG